MNIEKKLLEYFKFPETHPTNEELYKNLQHNLPELSKDKFDAVLKKLVENKKVKIVLDDQNKKRYHTRLETHFHFICTVCGGVKDITLENGAVEMIKDHVNSKIHSYGRVQVVNMSFEGRCHDCKQK